MWWGEGRWALEARPSCVRADGGGVTSLPRPAWVPGCGGAEALRVRLFALLTQRVFLRCAQKKKK